MTRQSAGQPFYRMGESDLSDLALIAEHAARGVSSLPAGISRTRAEWLARHARRVVRDMDRSRGR